MRTLKKLGRLLQTMMVVSLAAFLLINTTGCAKQYYIVDGTKKVKVSRAQLDAVFSDNEWLLEDNRLLEIELKECYQGK